MKANWRSARRHVLYRMRRRACAISSVCGDKDKVCVCGHWTQAPPRAPWGASDAGDTTTALQVAALFVNAKQVPK